MVKKNSVALVFPVLLFPSRWVHEKEKQDKIVNGEREPVT